MDNTINGRTPEEIRKGLECCSVDGLSCSNCSYCVSCDADIHALERDALAYIQQLERERDAAVKVMSRYRNCDVCKHHNEGGLMCITCKYPNLVDVYPTFRPNWEWRGVQEVE